MAKVTRISRTRPDVDYHLNYQLRAWKRIPEYAEWWADLDSDVKHVFEMEWAGITESRLRELQLWAAQGLLTQEEYSKYAELMKLVEQYRPTLERLLADEPTDTRIDDR